MQIQWKAFASHGSVGLKGFTRFTRFTRRQRGSVSAVFHQASTRERIGRHTHRSSLLLVSRSGAPLEFPQEHINRSLWVKREASPSTRVGVRHAQHLQPLRSSLGSYPSDPRSTVAGSALKLRKGEPSPKRAAGINRWAVRIKCPKSEP